MDDAAGNPPAGRWANASGRTALAANPQFPGVAGLVRSLDWLIVLHTNQLRERGCVQDSCRGL